MKRLQMLKGLHSLEKRDDGGTKSLHSLEKRDEDEMKKGLWSSQQHAIENNMPLTQGGEEKERGWHS